MDNPKERPAHDRAKKLKLQSWFWWKLTTLQKLQILPVVDASHVCLLLDITNLAGAMQSEIAIVDCVPPDRLNFSLGRYEHHLMLHWKAPGKPTSKFTHPSDCHWLNRVKKQTKQFSRCNELVWHVSLICIAFVMMSAWQRLPCCAHHFDDWSSNHSLALHSVQLTQNPDREKLALRRNVYKCASNRDTEMQLPCVDMRRWMHVNNKYDAYVYNQARNPQYMCITPWHICLAKQMTEIKTWWTKPYEIDFQTRALHKRHCIGTNYRRKQQLHRQQTPHEG